MRNAAYLSRDQLIDLGFASLGEDVLVHETCVLIGCENVELDDRVRIDPFCILTARERVTIGTRTHIGAHSALMGTAGISIGAYCGLSQGVRLLSAADDFKAGALIGPQVPASLTAVQSGRIILDRFSVVGANCVVLPSAHLEEGATVGALSLVKGVLPAWSVSAGVPAKKVADRDRDGVLRAAERLESGDY